MKKKSHYRLHMIFSFSPIITLVYKFDKRHYLYVHFNSFFFFSCYLGSTRIFFLEISIYMVHSERMLGLLMHIFTTENLYEKWVIVSH